MKQSFCGSRFPPSLTGNRLPQIGGATAMVANNHLEALAMEELGSSKHLLDFLDGRVQQKRINMMYIYTIHTYEHTQLNILNISLLFFP